ncbi:uncharacterized protein LOC108153049 [Drosophila miranda]|uniref:uncharacterized protein LOC108153049 n=1 Tax=Drosophila miranda TaxID=7229 RepID=UPI0007E6FB6B|nr:uncharacterized protein LOC108153049 [Drosophila miranda]
MDKSTKPVRGTAGPDLHVGQQVGTNSGRRIQIKQAQLYKFSSLVFGPGDPELLYLEEFLAFPNANTNVTLPVTRKNIRAVNYDPITQQIDGIEGRSHSIRLSLVNGTKEPLGQIRTALRRYHTP